MMDTGISHFRPCKERHFFKMSGWFVWCGSLVRGEDERYHLFTSRWPEEYGHDGWIHHSEIVRAEADSPEGPFEYKEVVLGRRDGNYWDRSNAHNVTVQQFGSRYYLYYTGNHGDGEYWTHRNSQRIGVAWADHPTGPWHRPDEPLLVLHPDRWDGLMHANPVATRLTDGRYLLMYKGVATGPPPAGGPVRHGVAFSKDPMGPFEAHPFPLFDLPGVDFPYEDPGLWEEDGVIYCLMKTMRAELSPTGEMGILLFRSHNGIDWEAAEPHFVIGRSIRMADGRTLSFERLERPQLFRDKDGTRILLLAAQPFAEGATAGKAHLVGPAKLPMDTPASFSVRLFWDPIRQET